MSLPLVLEQTSRWYYFAVPLACIIIVPALIGLIAGIRRKRELTPPRVLALIAVMVPPTWFIVLQAGWQVRTDDQGISLDAPLNIFETTGRIAWRDLEEIRFGQVVAKRPAPVVEIAGGGLVLTVPLRGVPASFWPALVEAVQAKAPQAVLRPGIDKESNAARWLERAKKESVPEPGSLRMVGYVARDGAGRALP